MKKKLIVLVAIAVILCTSLSFIACNKEKITDISSFGIEYLKSYVADITDAESIGVKKMEMTDSKDVRITKVASSTNAQDLSVSENSKFYLIKNVNGECQKIEFSDAEGNLLTQDDFPMQVYKFHVDKTSNLTYVQFCPNIKETINYKDIDGIVRPFYPVVIDKVEDTVYDYTTSLFYKTFIINNNTGKIYLLSGFGIKKIVNGILFGDKDWYYDTVFNEDNSLSFVPILKNPMVVVSTCFKDKYGNNYIINSNVRSIDNETKTFLIPYNESYMMATDGTVIKAEASYTDDGIEHLAVKKINKDFKEESIGLDETYSFDRNNNYNIARYLYEIKNGIACFRLAKENKNYFYYLNCATNEISSKKVENNCGILYLNQLDDNTCLIGKINSYRAFDEFGIYPCSEIYIANIKLDSITNIDLNTIDKRLIKENSCILDQVTIDNNVILLVKDISGENCFKIIKENNNYILEEIESLVFDEIYRNYYSLVVG